MRIIIGISLIILSFFTGVQVGLDETKDYIKEPIFISNPPKTIIEYLEQICYSWEGQYETQVLTCIKKE